MGELVIREDEYLTISHNGREVWAGDFTQDIREAMNAALGNKRYYSFCSLPYTASFYVADVPTLVTAEDVETYIMDMAIDHFNPGLCVLDADIAGVRRSMHFLVFPNEFVRVSSGEVFVVKTVAELCAAVEATWARVMLAMSATDIWRSEYEAPKEEVFDFDEVVA